MKLKKVLAVLIAVCMFAGLAVTAGAAYSTADGADFDAIAAGDSNAGLLQKAGDPPMEVVDGKLMISGRTADWNALDVTFESLEDGDYVLTVKMSADEEVTFNIADADAPYGRRVQETGTSATLVYNISVSGGIHDGQNRLRVNTEGTEDYYVESVTVTAAGGGAAETPVDTASVETTTGDAGGDKVKDGADTGTAGIAVISGIALLAVAGVAVSRKRK